MLILTEYVIAIGKLVR